jgi:hypothetical protein
VQVNDSNIEDAMTPSKEVDAAAGEAPARVDVIELLNEKREALSAARARYASAREMRDELAMGDLERQIDALKKEIIPELEAEVAVALEAKGRTEAEDRLLGIKRAYGSTTSAYGDDEKRVEQAVATLRESITTLNSRARKLEALRAEAAALADRFELKTPSLSIVPEPQQGIPLPAFWRLHSVRPQFEQCEHNFRQRRDYTEIGGTPGYDIIMKAGLQPFRALTKRESQAVADTAEERKPDPVLAQAAIEANALGNLGVPGGGVARG